MKQVVLLGGTGYIGTRLVQELAGQGYKVLVLTRRPHGYKAIPGVEYQQWTPRQQPLAGILNGVYAVVNLAGENIGQGRWTRRRKQQLLNSRVEAATLVAQAIEQCSAPPQVWIQASATGYYGLGNKVSLPEESALGKGFLAQVCQQWEEPARQLHAPSTRVAIVRTGVVLSEQSQVWRQLAMPLRAGALVVPGSGRQYVPWIHLTDEVRAIAFVLSLPSGQGVFNLAAPAASTMGQLAHAMAAGHRVWLRLRIPSWLLAIGLGKGKVQELITNSQQVVPQQLIDQGFEFKYPDVQSMFAK